MLDVAKCGVVDAPFSIHPSPGNGEIAVFPVNAWIIQIEFARVEPHQDANLVSREVFHLINLVLQNEGLRPRLHAREVWILDDNGCIKRDPRMLVEISADHFSIFGPGGECDGRAVHPDKALSVVVHK